MQYEYVYLSNKLNKIIYNVINIIYKKKYLNKTN